jgi:hypothetical protein
MELPFFRAPLGDGKRAVAERLGLTLLLPRLRAGHSRSAAAAVPLPTALQCGSGQVRQRGLQGIQAVIKRQQRMLAKGDKQRFFLHRQDGGAWWLRAHGRIVPLCPLLPLRHGVGGQGITAGKLGDALLTLRDRATHRRGRAGAAVSSLSQKASREGRSSYVTPSHPGTKQLISIRVDYSA